MMWENREYSPNLLMSLSSEPGVDFVSDLFLKCLIVYSLALPVK